MIGDVKGKMLDFAGVAVAALLIEQVVCAAMYRTQTCIHYSYELDRFGLAPADL